MKVLRGVDRKDTSEAGRRTGQEIGSRVADINWNFSKMLIQRLTASAVAVAFVMGLFLATPVVGAAFRNLTKGSPAPFFTRTK